MSGLVKDNVFGSSGTVAAAAGGLSWDTAVVTGSTVTVEAANGYFINTTSNACNVTLPAGVLGEEVSLIDYAGTFDTNNLTVTPDTGEKIQIVLNQIYNCDLIDIIPSSIGNCTELNELHLENNFQHTMKI